MEIDKLYILVIMYLMFIPPLFKCGCLPLLQMAVYLYPSSLLPSLKWRSQVSSIQQEFESYQQRSVRHSNLVQYLSMTHAYRDNKITVEVCLLAS